MPELHNVAVLTLSLNEEASICGALESLHGQSVQPGLLALVDSHSTDRTVQRAEPLVHRVYHAPRGKLTATDKVISVLEAKYAIIVVTDADTHYPPHWLETLTAPLLSGAAILTHGPNIMDTTIVPSYAAAVYEGLEALYAASIATAGRNRAFARWAYEQARFNTAMPQQNIATTWLEEELFFTGRMKRLGIVQYLPQAWCRTSERRAFLDGQHWAEAKAGLRF